MIITINALAAAVLVATIVVMIVKIVAGHLQPRVAVFLLIPILIVLFTVVANLLEHSGIDSTFDTVEEFLEVMIIPYFLLFLYAVSTETHIRARQRNQEALERAVSERDLLLQEIHHRVKNNLQTVAGLIQLQRNESEGEEANRHIGSIASRVAAIGLLHKQLSGDGSYATLRLDSYLSALAQQAMDEEAPRQTGVTIGVNAEPVTTNIETALPCGLIVNEFLLHALRRAEQGGRRIQVEVELHERSPGAMTLVISQPSLDLGDEMLVENMSLVDALVMQLDGFTRTEKGKTVSFVVEFSEVKKEENRWRQS